MSADRPNWATALEVKTWLREAFPKADPASLICVDSALRRIQDGGHIGDVDESIAAQMLAVAQEVDLVRITRGNALMSEKGGETLANAVMKLIAMSPEERAAWADPATPGAQRAHQRLLRFSGNA